MLRDCTYVCGCWPYLYFMNLLVIGCLLRLDVDRDLWCCRPIDCWVFVCCNDSTYDVLSCCLLFSFFFIYVYQNIFVITLWLYSFISCSLWSFFCPVCSFSLICMYLSSMFLIFIKFCASHFFLMNVFYCMCLLWVNRFLICYSISSCSCASYSCLFSSLIL